MFDRNGSASIFLRLDLKTRDYQIRMEPSDIEKNAFNSNCSQFEYLLMTIGACNAPATFQSLMNNIFHDCINEFWCVYIDDIPVFSKVAKSHFSHLEIVLKKMKELELYVSSKKWEFSREEMDFLGLLIGKKRIKWAQGRTKF